MPTKNDDLIDIRSASKLLGLSEQYVRAMLSRGSKHYSPTLARLMVATSSDYRRMHRIKAQWVFRAGDLRKWKRERQDGGHS